MFHKPIIAYYPKKSNKKAAAFSYGSRESGYYILSAISDPISEQETFFMPSDMISPVL